jgi:hypothetical protein
VVFGPTYFRIANAEDTAQILAQNKARGFHGILGSIDCVHWGGGVWKNCPFAWKGMYKGHKRACSVVLQTVADKDL